MEVIRCISTFLMWLPLDGRPGASFILLTTTKKFIPALFFFCFVTEQQLTDANLLLPALWTFLDSSLMIFRPLRGIFLGNYILLYTSHMTETESFNETYDNDDSPVHTNQASPITASTIYPQSGGCSSSSVTRGVDVYEFFMLCSYVMLC